MSGHRDRHRARKTYRRDRTGETERYVPTRLQAYIRLDQAAWLAEECGKRSIALRGKNAPLSELVREAIDLLIEYTQHQEFLQSKLGHGRKPSARTVSAATSAAPAGSPDAKSQESAAPGPQSSRSTGPS